MNLKVVFFLMLVTAVILEVIGDVYFKKWSLQNRTWMMLIGFAFYALGSLFWAVSLRYELLSKAGIIFMLMNLVLIALVGVFYFNENLSIINKIGVALAIISIILLEV